MRRTEMTPLTLNERSRQVSMNRRRSGFLIAGSRTFSERCRQLIAWTLRNLHSASIAACSADFQRPSRSGWFARGERRWQMLEMLRERAWCGRMHECLEHSRSARTVHCCSESPSEERAAAALAAAACAFFALEPA